MSYNVYMHADGSDEALPVDLFEDGGTYRIGGTDKAEFNITYNYGWFFYRFLDKDDGIRWLYRKTGAETVERLNQAVSELGINRYRDYWAPTPGNAGAALSRLLMWARQYPDGIFYGD